MDRVQHRLVHDEIEELVSPRHIFGSHPRARVRIFEPRDDRGPAVVVCSELADNPGASVTNAAGAMATQVRDRYLKGRAMVWVEHYPSEARGGWPETFDTAEFDELLDGSFCHPRWKHLGRERLEQPIGGPLEP
jgi:hypothetical protein